MSFVCLRKCVCITPLTSPDTCWLTLIAHACMSLSNLCPKLLLCLVPNEHLIIIMLVTNAEEMQTKFEFKKHRNTWCFCGFTSYRFHFAAPRGGLASECMRERGRGREREWLCFRVSEHIGPFLTTVTRRQYRVSTEMSSCSQNSP